MMPYVWTLVFAVILLGLLEALLSLRVLRFLLRRDDDSTETLPKAAVLLPLRGTDPSLEHCLGSLLRQDYPDYRVHVMVDSRDDPAFRVVAAVMEQSAADRLELHVLESIPDSCSLKCAAVAELMDKLDRDTDVVVLVDADTVPPAVWLRRMVEGLRQSRKCAISGMRWFIPRGNSPAAFIRYLWNAGSVVQMFHHRIAWGGSLAMDRTLLDKTDLRDRLRQAYGEDTILDTVLREHNLPMEFNPSLVLPTREDTGFTGFFGWAVRQMVSVRLHHAGWLPILAFGLVQTLLILAGLLLVVHGLWNGDARQAAIMGGALLAYELLQSGLLLAGEALLGQRMQTTDKTQRRLSLIQIITLPAAILLTQILHGFILLNAALRKEVTWRGIPYRIEAPGRIRMLSYAPYEQKSNEDNHSL